MNKEDLLEELNTSFKRIGDIITSLWGTEELHTYFNTILLQDRSERKGFPEDVWKLIAQLQQLHEVGHK
jgi:hypothetical protein